jgi:hypothetical protein
VARIFEAIRGVVGDKLEIGFRGHAQFSTAGAIRLASILESYVRISLKNPCTLKT